MEFKEGYEQYWTYDEYPLYIGVILVRTERCFTLKPTLNITDAFQYIPSFITHLSCDGLTDEHIPYLIEVFKRMDNLKILHLYKNKFSSMVELMDHFPSSLGGIAFNDTIIIT